MEDHGTHAFPEGMREQLAKTEDFDVIADVFHQLEMLFPAIAEFIKN